jgi:predicted amidophosphoribosyltransferase
MTDNTSDIEKTNTARQTMQQAGFAAESPKSNYPTDAIPNYAVQYQSAEGMACPYCGALNEPEAMYCASCGEPIGKLSCPYCGKQMDADADFCESCHHYAKKDVCSYCGSHLGGNEAYCSSCGSPRGGVACPVCHTMNDFAFCKQCGTALTEEAREMVKELQKDPEYQLLLETAAELSRLDDCLPYSSETDVQREQTNAKLRQRVLTLLAKDEGVENPVVELKQSNRMTRGELMDKKRQQMEQLSAILERLAVPPIDSPVKARNFAMASKPMGVRLAWMCNYKHAMHSSPCGCAKPHLGGKWVTLGKNSSNEIKDDK